MEISHRVSLEQLTLNGFQKAIAIEERQFDLMLHELDISLTNTLPSMRARSLPSSSDSVSSLGSDSLCSPFSPSEERHHFSIMPSPVRLKPSEMMQVGIPMHVCVVPSLLPSTHNEMWMIG